MGPEKGVIHLLKVNFEKGKPGVLMATGDLGTVLAELGMVVKGIHAQMEKADPVCAMLFKQAFQGGIADENGPVWGGEMPSHFGLASCIHVQDK